MYTIKRIKQLIPITYNSKIRSFATNPNTYTIDLYDKNRTTITNFGNCSEPTTNFSYNKNPDGTCIGTITLKGGYTYTITLTCGYGEYYSSNGGFSRVTSSPNIYIYFSYANSPSDATNVGNQTRSCTQIACDASIADSSCSQSICTETSTFTVKLTNDNNTLHFKVENTQNLNNGFVEFSGDFTITAVPNS